MVWTTTRNAGSQGSLRDLTRGASPPTDHQVVGSLKTSGDVFDLLAPPNPSCNPLGLVRTTEAAPHSPWLRFPRKSGAHPISRGGSPLKARKKAPRSLECVPTSLVFCLGLLAVWWLVAGLRGFFLYRPSAALAAHSPETKDRAYV